MANKRARSGVSHNGVQKVAIHTKTSLATLEGLRNNNLDRIGGVVLSGIKKGKLHVLAAVVVGTYHDFIPSGSRGSIHENRMSKRIHMEHRSNKLGRRIAKVVPSFKDIPAGGTVAVLYYILFWL